jgi:CheY-like chemotaxis protein
MTERPGGRGAMPISTVLLVDDDEDLRLIGKMALSDVGGWTTLLAAGGPEAIECAARERPDVILLDMMMPDMDGAAVMSELRGTVTTADIPVIFMTAKIQRHEVEEYLALGAAGVIGKPFDPLMLAEQVRGILDGMAADGR